jgi:tetratricopeptide (TPR) repeat protein
MWLLDRGDLSAAEAAFRRAGELDSAGTSGAIGLARVFLVRGENQEAIDTLERLLENHPGDRYALQLLGTAYRRLGREDDARFALAVGAGAQQRIHDPWLDDVALARRGFAARLKQATGYAMAGRFSDAIPLLEQLRSERPDDIALATHLGGIYGAAGRPAEAIALLDAVLARDRDNFDAHVNLATTYVSARALDRASIHADRAVALRPGSAKAHETRGMIQMSSRRPADAIASFDRALALDPRNQRPRAWIGWIFLEQQQNGHALRSFEGALEHDPMMVDALVGIGVIQIRIGAFDQARITLSRAEQIDPSNARLETARALLSQRSHE